MCEICSKLTIKTPEQLMLLFLKDILKLIHTIFNLLKHIKQVLMGYNHKSIIEHHKGISQTISI